MRDLLCDEDSGRSLPIKQDERMGGMHLNFRAHRLGLRFGGARACAPVIVADATNVLVDSEAQVHALMRQARLSNSSDSRL